MRLASFVKPQQGVFATLFSEKLPKLVGRHFACNELQPKARPLPRIQFELYGSCCS